MIFFNGWRQYTIMNKNIFKKLKPVFSRASAGKQQMIRRCFSIWTLITSRLKHSRIQKQITELEEKKIQLYTTLEGLSVDIQNEKKRKQSLIEEKILLKDKLRTCEKRLKGIYLYHFS